MPSPLPRPAPWVWRTGACGNPIGRRGFNFIELSIQRAGGRDCSAGCEGIALGSASLPFPKMWLLALRQSCPGAGGCCGTRALVGSMAPEQHCSVLKHFFVSPQMLGSLGQRFSICQRLLEQVTHTMSVPCLIPYQAHSCPEQEDRVFGASAFFLLQ